MEVEEVHRPSVHRGSGVLTMDLRDGVAEAATLATGLILWIQTPFHHLGAVV